MRRSILLFFALIIFPIWVARTSIAQEYVLNEIIVMVENGIQPEHTRFTEMNLLCGTTFLKMTSGQEYHLRVLSHSSVENAVACWKQFTEVRYAQPNFILKPMK